MTVRNAYQQWESRSPALAMNDPTPLPDHGYKVQVSKDVMLYKVPAGGSKGGYVSESSNVIVCMAGRRRAGRKNV